MARNVEKCKEMIGFSAKVLVRDGKWLLGLLLIFSLLQTFFIIADLAR
jgi:hypothetical protein